jgi:hypothetical protein
VNFGLQVTHRPVSFKGGGQRALVVTIQAQASNTTSSQQASNSIDAFASALINLPSGNNVNLSGSVWGGYSGGGTNTSLFQGSNLGPLLTADDLKDGFVTWAWDNNGQSANASIIPSRFSKVGGLAGFFIILPSSGILTLTLDTSVSPPSGDGVFDSSDPKVTFPNKIKGSSSASFAIGKVSPKIIPNVTHLINNSFVISSGSRSVGSPGSPASGSFRINCGDMTISP